MLLSPIYFLFVFLFKFSFFDNIVFRLLGLALFGILLIANFGINSLVFNNYLEEKDLFFPTLWKSMKEFIYALRGMYRIYWKKKDR